MSFHLGSTVARPGRDPTKRKAMIRMYSVGNIALLRTSLVLSKVS